MGTSTANGNGQAPPHAPDAERSLIGSLLLSQDPEAVRRVLVSLSPDDIFNYHFRIMYRAIAELRRTLGMCDAVALGERLGDEFVQTIGMCVESVPHASHMDYYADIVRDRAERRRRIDQAKQQIAEAFDISRPIESREDPYKRITIGELITQHPHLDPYLIDGLVRVGETANIIAPSKVGKSWLLYLIILSLVTGRDLFGRHRCRPSRVALIDNELKRSVLAHRIKTVADAMGIHPAEYADRIEPFCLRGKLLDLAGIGDHIISKIPKGEFDCFAIDAWYRVIGDAETNNPEMARAYNTVDAYAEQTAAAWILIHHSTKGSQSEKRVTDVGAGSGSQSRAADSHIILREHEEDGAVVMEAAVRSFAPVEPVPLRFTFPLWAPADDMDPTALKGRKTAKDEAQTAKDQEGINDIIEALKSSGAMTEKSVRDAIGMGRERCKRLMGILYKEKKVSRKTVEVRGNECFEYELL